MAYKYKLKEQDGEEVSPSSRDQVNYDLVLTPKSAEVEEVVKALETVDNYGRYVSNLRNNDPKIEKALKAHFGTPAERRIKANQGKFPELTKAAVDDFIKTFNRKSTLLKYKVADNTIVFPKGSNPAKDLTKKIIDVVMKNAKIDYSIADKEAIDETSVDKLDQEAKIYFMQQVKQGKIKELPKDPKTEYMKIKMSKDNLKEIIKEKLAQSVLSKYKTGPESVILSKLVVLEKVLKQLRKLPDVDAYKTIDMVLKTFDEIREI